MKKLVIIGAVVVAVGVGGYTFANSMATKKAKEELDAAIASLPMGLAKEVSYEDVSASAFSKAVTITNISVNNIGSIDEVLVSGDFRDNEEVYIPEDLEISISNLNISGPMAELMLMSLPKELQGAGYNFHTKWDYNTSKDTAELALNITANDIVSWNSNWMISDMSPASSILNSSENQNKMALSRQMQNALNDVKFGSINMSLNNEGNLKALADSFLAKNNMTTENLLTMLNGQLEKESEEVSKKVIESMIAFVSGMNKFELSASFGEGLTLEEIQQTIENGMGPNPASLFKAINLTTSGK